MKKSIKDKLINSVVWSAVEKFLRQGLMTLFSIIIARQLLPSDYGLVAMLTIFLTIAQIFVDSGFVEALIQKQNRTDTDFSTVFWFNILVALLLYVTLFLCSPLIADFYGEPILNDLLKCISIIFVINAFRTVQQAKLNIAMDFRRQTRISVVAMTISGIIGMWMAYHGFGVWTLVWQQLLLNFFNVFFLWISSRWIPKIVFSKHSFKELFSFGSRLLISRTLHAIYTNGTFLLMGKFFPSSTTGLYSYSNQMASFIPTTVNDVVARVAYPIECESQDNDEELQRFFFQILRLTCFVLFPLMMGLAALAEPIVRLLLTEKWMETVPLIRILCFAWIWWPASNMSWQLLNVKHRSDYCLKAEVIKKTIGISILLISFLGGIKMVCIGMLIYYIADVYVITWFTRRILPGVTFASEMKALLPILVRAAAMGTGIYMLDMVISSDEVSITVGIVTGIVLYMTMTLLTVSREMCYLLEIMKKRR